MNFLHTCMECGGVERESYCERSFRQPEPWTLELQAYGLLEEGGWSPSEECYSGSQESHEHQLERVARPVALQAGAWKRIASSGTIVGGQRTGIAFDAGASEWGGRGRGLSLLISHRPISTSEGTLPS